MPNKPMQRFYGYIMLLLNVSTACGSNFDCSNASLGFSLFFIIVNKVVLGIFAKILSDLCFRSGLFMIILLYSCYNFQFLTQG